MLTDPEEIRIISTAKQAGVRDPERSRKHFRNIETDFFGDKDVSGHRVLDLGPGQFDFAVVATERGVAEVVGVDRDPAVLELGRYKGFDVIDADLRRLTSEQLAGPYDGLFCKFALNALWFVGDADALRAHMAVVLGSLAPSGWAWIAPWNGIPKNAGVGDGQVQRIMDVQRKEFEAAGFRTHELSERETKRYGVHGSTANSVLFTRGLG